MSAIKRIFGIVWSIVIVVLMPIIAFSLITFGVFALKGEYDTLEDI